MFAVIVLVKNVIDELLSLRNKIVLVLELRSLIFDRIIHAALLCSVLCCVFYLYLSKLTFITWKN